MTSPHLGSRYHKRVADLDMGHLEEAGRYPEEYRMWWLNPVLQSRLACSQEEELEEHLDGKQLIVGADKGAGRSWTKAGQAGQMRLDRNLFQGCPPRNPNPQ